MKKCGAVENWDRGQLGQKTSRTENNSDMERWDREQPERLRTETDDSCGAADGDNLHGGDLGRTL